MPRMRLMLVLVALAAFAAAGFFYVKGRSLLAHSEDTMERRWGVWVGSGAIDQPKLQAGPGTDWSVYQPQNSAVKATPFHSEFGFYIKQTQVYTTRAAIALGGLGLVMLVLAITAKPPPLTPSP